MPKPFTEWKVLPHGKLTTLDPDLMTVEGDLPMPLGKITRRMTVVRLSDARLIIFNAIALDEDEMRTLEDFGKPAYLIVPNDYHRLDARIWKDRYPAVQVIAPAGAREKVAEVVAVDATSADFGELDVMFVTVPGTSGREAALEARGANGTTLIVNDVIGNVRDASGVSGWFLRLMGFAGEKPHVPLPVKWLMIKDKPALAAELRRWSLLPSLKRILVSHGAPIEDDPPRVLRELAASLS
jgi:hypothetical protein